MNLDAIWPSLTLLAVALALISLPMFRHLNEAPPLSSQHQSRSSTIDGLRGFLAFGVFIFHFRITHEFLQTGLWDVPATRYYALLGPVPVSLFFMITGYLFWQKLLRANGRMRWRDLYLGRLFRIAPLYLFVVICMLWIVFARTGFELHQPASDVIASILKWLALGVVYTQPDVNGYRASHVLAGVTWTIAYEWAFYASLVFTAVFVRRKWLWPFIIAAISLAFITKLIFHVSAIGFAALFLLGMMVASLLAHERTRRYRLRDPIASLIASALLIAVFAVARTGYESTSAILLAGFFYLICSGATLFGLLTSQMAHRLGNISYSIYLTQGLILTSIFSFLSLRSYALQSPLHYWLCGVLCTLGLVASSMLTYLLLEKPCIALGRRLIHNSHEHARRENERHEKAWPLASPIAAVHESDAAAGLADKFPSY